MKTTIINSIAIVTTQITVEKIRFLKEVQPNALKLFSDVEKQTGLMFVVEEGKDTALSVFGLELNPKRDLVIQEDKPLTPEVLSEKWGQALLRLQAVESQIEAAYAAQKARLGELEVVSMEV